MNPSDFHSTRTSQLKVFEDKYAVLKSQYSEALNKSISETDRAKQCVLIKSALDANQKLTELVQGFLVGSDSGGCKLTPEKVRSLRDDIDKYKKQYEEIQQGKNNIYALQKSHDELQQKIEVLHGIETMYIVVLALGLIILTYFVISSGIRGTFNTQSVSSILPGGFTKSSYF